MKKISIGVDYSNICKDYNTSYLDRDNLDPATSKCMKQVLSWSKAFISELLEHFSLNLYHLSSSSPVKIEDVSAKRFLFYSLEKEITLQSFVASKTFNEYANTSIWASQSDNGVLINNDEDGGSLYFVVDENSDLHHWIQEKLAAFSLDEVSFEGI